MSNEVRDSLLDGVIEEKLKTPKGRKSTASYMVTYLQDVAKYGSDKGLDSTSHRLMLQRAAKILRVLVEAIPDE